MGCSAGNAGSLSTGSVVPLGMPGILRQAPRMLLDPDGPLSVPPRYWLASAPWLLRFVSDSRPERVAQISDALKQLTVPALVYHQQIMRELGNSDLIEVTGQLHIYPDQKALSKDNAGWQLRRQQGVQIEAVGGSDIRSMEPQIGPHYQVGYFLPEQGMVVNPLRHAQLIAEGLAQRGVAFIQDEALGLQVDGQRITGVVCKANRYEADHVVICAGAWSAKLLKNIGFDIPLESQRGYHVDLTDSGISLSRTVVAADRKIFIAPMETGLRLAGTVEFSGLERGPTAKRSQALLKYGKLIFPALNDAAKQETWMGHRPCLPDSLPILGAAPGFAGLWLNFGHGHLGLTMSAISGSLVAEAMQGQAITADLTPYSITRFGAANTRRRNTGT
jgi:D-amino-acid dehydrogenase